MESGYSLGYFHYMIIIIHNGYYQDKFCCCSMFLLSFAAVFFFFHFSLEKLGIPEIFVKKEQHISVNAVYEEKDVRVLPRHLKA